MCLQQADHNDLINVLAKANSFGDLISTNNISTMYKFSKDFVNSTKDIFLNTRKKAMLTGKMLAHFLANECLGNGVNDVLKG
jgi:hypothetical protein